MTIKINIDSSAFEGALSKVGPDIQKAVYSAIATTNTATIKVARRVHRHKTRSGSLNKSIVPTKTAKSRGVKLNLSIAKYARRIHDGDEKTGWAPDPFLTNAFNEKTKKRHYLKKIIININRVLKRVF